MCVVYVLVVLLDILIFHFQTTQQVAMSGYETLFPIALSDGQPFVELLEFSLSINCKHELYINIKLILYITLNFVMLL